MAWTVTKDGLFYELIPDGSTNFDWATYVPDRPEGIKIDEIQVYFSAANDVVCIRNRRTTGATVFKYTTLDGSSVAKRFYKGLMYPVILHADQTYGTPANWKIIIQEAA